MTSPAGHQVQVGLSLGLLEPMLDLGNIVIIFVCSDLVLLVL